MNFQIWEDYGESKDITGLQKKTNIFLDFLKSDKLICVYRHRCFSKCADKSINKTEPRESQVVRLHGVTPVFLRTGYAAAGKHHPSTFTLHWIYNFGLLQCTYLWLPWWDTPFASYRDMFISREPLKMLKEEVLSHELPQYIFESLRLCLEISPLML